MDSPLLRYTEQSSRIMRSNWSFARRGILTFMSCHVSCCSLEKFVKGEHMFMGGCE